VHVRFGKGAKERITYLTPVARQHLKKYLASRSDVTPALFTNAKGDRLQSSGIQFILKQIEKRSGVSNVHPHRFRRTFATKLAARGMDIQEIKVLLGHSDINTTLTYVYTNDAQIKSSYAKYCV
jgi:site-specific recombinase XerD